MTKENHTSLLKMIHFSSRIEEASVKGFFYGHCGKRFQKHSFQCWNYGCFGHSDYYIFSIQIIGIYQGNQSRAAREGTFASRGCHRAFEVDAFVYFALAFVRPHQCRACGNCGYIPA